MPAITRTAPRRMAMLTESREAIEPYPVAAKPCNRILIVATLRRQPISAVGRGKGATSRRATIFFAAGNGGHAKRASSRPVALPTLQEAVAMASALRL
jgi:hypothetical protein